MAWDFIPFAMVKRDIESCIGLQRKTILLFQQRYECEFF
jgi:hypothetical protein